MSLHVLLRQGLVRRSPVWVVSCLSRWEFRELVWHSDFHELVSISREVD